MPGYSLALAEKDREAEATEEEEFGHLFVWYGDIRNRQSRGQQFEPIELAAILAYEHFLAKVGIEMSAFEWEVLFRLDSAWQKAVVPPAGNDNGSPGGKTPPRRR